MNKKTIKTVCFIFCFLNLITVYPTTGYSIDDELALDLGLELDDNQSSNPPADDNTQDDYLLEDQEITLEEETPTEEQNTIEENQKDTEAPATEQKKTPTEAYQVDNNNVKPEQAIQTRPVIKKPLDIKSSDVLTKVRNKRKVSTTEIEAWISQTADLNMCLENGKTMLLYLISYSTNTEALQLLIDYGADVQTHCTPRYEALFIAATNNPSGAVIETLINNGANIIEKDYEGNTALILSATYNKSPEVIQVLLEYGLKIDAKNNYGFDSLTMAAYENTDINILETLINNGSDLQSRDKEGRTALMAAAVKGNDEVMQYLIKRGANFNAKDNNGLSVLDYYNKRKYLDTLGFEASSIATPSERLNDEFKFITENHHRFNQALQDSIHEKDSEKAVADALANLADVDILDKNGCTTFVNAAIYNRSKKVLEELIEGKAKINATCLDNKNALMFISAQADSSHIPALQIEKAKFLLEKGIDINHQDDNGNTALMYAIANQADIKYIRMLLENGASVNTTSQLGETALWTAIRQKSTPDVLKLLIEYGADVNQTDKQGETPLWYLLRTNGSDALVKTLLHGGASTDIANAAGDIPLWYIINKGGSETLVATIIANQKDIDIKNEHGDTPLLYALKNNYPPQFVKMLLNKGANPQIRDREGHNAYDILRNNQYFDAAVQKKTRERVLNNWQ